MYKKGSIVLIRFPFSDQSSSKVRPALLLCDQKDADIILLPITSVETGKEQIALLPSQIDFDLIVDSFIRYTKIQRIEATLVYKVLGKTSPELFSKVKTQCLTYLAKT